MRTRECRCREEKLFSPQDTQARTGNRPVTLPFRGHFRLAVKPEIILELTLMGHAVVPWPPRVARADNRCRQRSEKPQSGVSFMATPRSKFRSEPRVP